ncbi:MAG: hypothetical protein KGJ68_10870 [Gammaproteobacteria bacterium]|nr:hypothetical protein [Gammaproteobacteria bacterium]
MNLNEHGVTDSEVVRALVALGNGERVELDTSRGLAPGLTEADGERFRRLISKAAEDPREFAEEFLPPPLGGRATNAGALKVLSLLKPRLALAVGAGPTASSGGRSATPMRLSLSYFHDYPDVESVLTYGLLLLLDSNREYGKSLSRCHLPSCSKFYLAKPNPKGGPANRYYCKPAHRDEAHNSKQNRKPRRPK